MNQTVPPFLGAFLWGAVIKTMDPLSYKRPRSTFRYHEGQNFFSIYKNDDRVEKMQKNSPDDFTTIECDPVTGEYKTVIPEWIINDEGWYEGTELHFQNEGGEITVKEKD